MNRTVKLLLIVSVLALVVLAIGCSRSAGPTGEKSASKEDTSARPSTIVRTSLTPASLFRAELSVNPSEAKAGEPTALTFTVKDSTGAVVRDLQIVHEKPMHLLVVSDDLTEFDHIHPQPQPDGTYKVDYKFPNGGGYKLYADFTPPGQKQVVERYDINVSGTARPRTPLVEDNSQPSRTVGSLTVTMFSDKPLRAKEELMLNFAVADAESGKPVTDLQKYLGALAHFVIISEDASEFLHVHPMEVNETKYGEGAMKMGEMKEGQARMPAVSAHTTFPRAGVYKLWAQFQRGGQVITVPFVLRVGEAGAPAAPPAQAKTAGPSGTIQVKVSSAGYEPSKIEVKRGKPIKIAFYRADAENCAGEVVFPSLNIRKGLKVGETTIVEFTPKEQGELTFSCGMGMLNGKLVVTN